MAVIVRQEWFDEQAFDHNPLANLRVSNSLFPLALSGHRTLHCPTSLPLAHPRYLEISHEAIALHHWGRSAN